MTTQLGQLLAALDRADDERMSVCHANGRFVGEVTTVALAPALAAQYTGEDIEGVWFGCQVLHPRVTSGRGTTNDVIGLRSLNADLDVKPGGMGSYAAAQGVIAVLSDLLGTVPTAVVWTGHGLQPHWAIERGLGTDWPDEKDPRHKAAVALWRRWGRLVNNVAAGYGGAVDSTFDLSRVARCPGTVNRKDPANPVEATLEETAGFPVTLGMVLEVCNAEGVTGIPEDVEVLGETVSEASKWPWAASTCRYTMAMVARWVHDEAPHGRHARLVSQAARLAAAHRYGCLTESDHTAAVAIIRSRLLADREETPPGEVATARRWGQARVEAKSDAGVARELGGHEHLPEPTPFDSAPDGAGAPVTGRRVLLTCAADIEPQRAKWAWEGRMPVGSFALLAGREGVGKSTFAYHLAALLTRGELPGEFEGTPRAVLICATEDSWAHIIVPRLMAAGADLKRVYRVEVVSAEDVHVGLSLPHDLVAVGVAVEQTSAALLLLDPLMSRVDSGIDTHKDGELRQALEPMGELADRYGLLVLGLIHFNKTGSSDVLDRVMGSRAFVAVARSVSVVVSDPDDEDERRRLFSTPKNNQGTTDLPSLIFTVENTDIPTSDGPTQVGHIVHHGECATTAREAMERINEDPDARSLVSEAAEWLLEYLREGGGSVECKKATAEAAKLGYKGRTLYKARRAAGITSNVIKGLKFKQTAWTVPDPVSSSRVSSTEEI